MNDNVKTAVSCSLDILFLFFLPDGVFVCFSVIWGEKKKTQNKTENLPCLLKLLQEPQKWKNTYVKLSVCPIR